MSQTRVRLNNLSTQKVTGRSLRLSRLSRKRFPFPSAAAPIINYIEDVFSTYLYTGNGGTQTITNGIDLSGKGGLVWTKGREGITNHFLVDSVRGVSKRVSTDTTFAEGTSTDISSFNSNGFSLQYVTAQQNENGVKYASWTFRKQAKFFDVVTYTGTGVASRAIAHNLGSAPGMMIVKRTDAVQNWPVYHRSVPTGTGYLNTTQQFFTGAGNGVWGDAAYNNIAPTSTVFYVGSDGEVNANGGTYVAYLFAHDAGGFGLTGTDNVISCGSFTGSSGNATIDLGWEPQWILLKNISQSENWHIYDVSRKMIAQLPTGGSPGLSLKPNLADAEAGNSLTGPAIDPTGFRCINGNGIDTTNTNIGSNQYIYIAIRRGPMKTPTSGTSVFVPTTYTGSSSDRTLSSSINPDTFWLKARDNDSHSSSIRRLSATPYLTFSSVDGDTTNSAVYQSNPFTVQNGVLIGTNSVLSNFSGLSYVGYFLKRAPSFHDTTTYVGNSSDKDVSHNLGVVPEMMFIYHRGGGAAYGRVVYHKDVGNGYFLQTIGTDARITSSNVWRSATPSSTQFFLGNFTSTNNNTIYYIADLFATCPGVSKVGSYTGTGTTLSIDCGFTAGARFVMIKRTDSAGDWYVWDTARGIVAGNDPYWRLNATGVEVTNTDYIDPYNPGFEISSTAPAAINASGGTYIFLAIA